MDTECGGEVAHLNQTPSAKDIYLTDSDDESIVDFVKDHEENQ